MNVTKKQLVNGIIKFIENDVIPDVGDRNKKFVLAMAKDSLKGNPDIIDNFLESPMIATLIMKDGEEYDISGFASTLKDVLSGYDSYPIAIPKIPLFSPEAKIIKITVDDIDRIMKYMMPQEMV